MKMAEMSKKQRKPVVKGKIYKTYHRVFGHGRFSNLFIVVGSRVYAHFRVYTTKRGAVTGAENLNREHGTTKFRAFETDVGFAVYQRLPVKGRFAVTPANLKDETWMREH